MNGDTIELASNPKVNGQPVLLTPLDILRQLPIALDWDGIVDAASHNATLRNRVNTDIGNIWSLRTRKDKAKIRDAVMQSRRSFEALLEMLSACETKPYDSARDPEGELFWRRHLSALAQAEPLRLEPFDPSDRGKAAAVVEQIIEQFRHLIEDRRYSAELYQDNGRPRPERAAQRFFFSVADCHCKANNLDITPEADTGSGNVDFKFSAGYSCRIMVEIKLSTNSRLIPGFQHQITSYSTAEDAIASYYVVIDVGYLRRKDQSLLALRNQWANNEKLKPELRFIDGKLRPSASVR